MELLVWGAVRTRMTGEVAGANRQWATRWETGFDSALGNQESALTPRYQVSMQGRFLCSRGAGGGVARRALVTQRRESRGSMTSSISK